MTVTETHTRSTGLVTRLGAKLIAYARLGKYDAYQQLLGPALAIALLAHEVTLTGEHVLVLVLGYVALVAFKVVTCAADDLTGYRNGSDAANYAYDGYRPPTRKPLLTRALSEREAVGFITVFSLIGLATGVGALAALGWRAPLGALITFAVVSVVAVQYSSGLRFSYIPGGLELTIFLVSAATVAVPYWLIAGTLSATAIALSAVMGAWLVLVVSYANIPDRAGDAAVNRRTLAVVLAPRTLDKVIIGETVVMGALTLAPFAFGSLSPWTVVLTAPLFCMYAFEIRHGIGGRQPLRARRIAFRSVNVGTLVYLAAILLS